MTLHSSKGLAVSLFDFAESLTAPNLYEDLSVAEYLFPFEKKRHCSHLIDHSRRELPPTFLRNRSSVPEVNTSSVGAATWLPILSAVSTKASLALYYVHSRQNWRVSGLSSHCIKCRERQSNLFWERTGNDSL